MKKALLLTLFGMFFAVGSTAYAQSSGGEGSGSGGGVNMGTLPMPLTTEILKSAKDFFGLSLGQMLQRYHACECTIEPIDPVNGLYRVTIGGGGVITDITADI